MLTEAGLWRASNVLFGAIVYRLKPCMHRHLRRYSSIWALIILSMLILVGDVKAATLQEAEIAYAEGRYLDAAQIAEKAGGAGGFAFAASSLNVHALYYADRRKRSELYQRAMGYAEKAIEIDSKSFIGHFELARAMGEYARGIGRVRAMNEKVVERIRQHLEIAISLNDNYADAHHALGRWHAGLIEAMGSFLGRSLFGAKKKNAIFHLERALELDPEGIEIHHGSAIGFLALGKRKYRKKAEFLLSRISAFPKTEVYHVNIQAQSVERIRELNAPEETNNRIHDR